MKAVKLRNGAEEADILVKSVMLSIENLWQEGLGGVLAVYDLREICRGNGTKVSKGNMDTLKRLNLVEPDGRVHQSIRNVVESALKGESFETKLVPPIA